MAKRQASDLTLLSKKPHHHQRLHLLQARLHHQRSQLSFTKLSRAPRTSTQPKFSFTVPPRCLTPSIMSTGEFFSPYPRPFSQISSIVISSPPSSISLTICHACLHILTMSVLARCTRSVFPGSLELLCNRSSKPHCCIRPSQDTRTYQTDITLAILRCDGLHIGNCFHLFWCCIRNR